MSSTRRPATQSIGCGWRARLRTLRRGRAVRRSGAPPGSASVRTRSAAPLGGRRLTFRRPPCSRFQTNRRPRTGPGQRETKRSPTSTERPSLSSSGESFLKRLGTAAVTRRPEGREPLQCVAESLRQQQACAATGVLGDPSVAPSAILRIPDERRPTGGSSDAGRRLPSAGPWRTLPIRDGWKPARSARAQA